MATPSPARSFMAVMVLVFVSIGVIFAVDMLLADAENVDSRAQAARLFRQAQALMARGNNAVAVERIEDALALERGDRDYLRALAQAQLAAGQTEDAVNTANDLLEADPTDGQASLIMARALVKQERFNEAISYYHRAVYGHWLQDPVANQLNARFELINLLAYRNSKEELLAELLPLQDEPPRSLQEKKRLGQLFLQAGSPSRAEVLFRGVLRDAPDDAEAYDGLGQAEFAQSRYGPSQRDFQNAVRLDENDAAARKGLELCNQLLALDPTLRGLGQKERFRRSLKLLDLTRGDALACAGANPAPDMQELLAAATAPSERIPAARESDAAESNLDAAERLWQARLKDCKAPPAPDSPLALVLARVSQ